MLEVTDEVPGAKELIEWFGYWPSFHDAEILDVKLDRSDQSTVRIHTFEITDRVSKQGSYICTKHVIVNFVLNGITNLHLDCFNSQNVISGLDLRQTDEGYELTLEPCYGLEGTITANVVHLELQPGLPPGSIYMNSARD
jgi:Immunity protein 50